MPQVAGAHAGIFAITKTNSRGTWCIRIHFSLPEMKRALKKVHSCFLTLESTARVATGTRCAKGTAACSAKKTRFAPATGGSMPVLLTRQRWASSAATDSRRAFAHLGRFGMRQRRNVCRVWQARTEKGQATIIFSARYVQATHIAELERQGQKYALLTRGAILGLLAKAGAIVGAATE